MHEVTDVATDNGLVVQVGFNLFGSLLAKLLFWQERKHSSLLLACTCRSFVSQAYVESSQSAETCAVVNETKPQSAWNVEYS